MSTVETKRKCKVCKEYIIFEKEMPVMVDKTTPEYYHYTCFVDFTKKKKNNKLSVEEIEKMAKDLQVKYKDKILWLIDKNHLYKYLMRAYDIVLLPNNIYTTLELVFTGKYKNMSDSVEPAELLDMFERKQDFLNKTYYWNISKGKEFKDNSSRLRYDLAIVMSKVDSYRKWKETQKIVEVTKEQSIKENKNRIDFTKISSGNNKDKINIDNILEEI